MITVVIAVAVLATPAAAQRRPLGTETTIANAANGGIRSVAPGPPGSPIGYLQDRTMRWYKVTLTGPCLSDRTLDTVGFKTDINGNFDRFSTVTSRRYPGRVCGVTSIVTSAPPPGQPGHDAH